MPRFGVVLLSLSCALFLVTCQDDQAGPSGVGGPLEIAGGGCKDSATNAAIDALALTLSGKTKSTVQGILQTHCKNVETFLKNNDALNAGLETFRAFASIIDLKADILPGQAIDIEEAFCTLGGVECPPWGDVPWEAPNDDIDFYDAIAVGQATYPANLEIATPLADLNGGGVPDDNVAISVQIAEGKTVAGAITITTVSGAFVGECNFTGNSPFTCDGGVYEVTLFPESDVVFADDPSASLALAQSGSESRVGVCEGAIVLTDHDGEVSELETADLPPGLICDGAHARAPSGFDGLVWRMNRFMGVTPAWAGRGGAMFANSEYGGGVGLRSCTISGTVATTFDNSAEGVLVTVTDSDGDVVGTPDTTDDTGFYSVSFDCPDQDGELYTILAEKQPGHPAFNDTDTTTLPTVGGDPPAEVTTADIDFTLEP